MSRLLGVYSRVLLTFQPLATVLLAASIIRYADDPMKSAAYFTFEIKCCSVSIRLFSSQDSG
jgi:hypothetical protein